MKIPWLDEKVTLLASHRHNRGTSITIREILFRKVCKTIIALRQLEQLYDDFEIDEIDYRKKKAILKNKLLCWTPAALLESRGKDNVIIISRTSLMQLDIDEPDLRGYDIEEAKQAIFNLPWVAYCGLSCSGRGFYALVRINEPERLREYAEHIFQVLLEAGIKVDTSKGRNATDLRYFSYDANPLIREYPEALQIRHFRTQKSVNNYKNSPIAQNRFSSAEGLLKFELAKIQNAQVGNRWPTVQHASFTLGGLSDTSLLDSIIAVINGSDAYAGEEIKYIQCAKDCFKAGFQKPLHPTAAQDFDKL